MKRRRPLPALVILLSMTAAAPADPSTVALQVENDTDTIQAVTPLRALAGGVRFGKRASEVTVRVAGADVRLVGQVAGRRPILGVDLDGDGKVASNEYQPVGRDRAVGVRLRIPGRQDLGEVLVRFDSLRVYPGRPGFIGGVYRTGLAWTGTIAGQTIRLLDEDQDGRLRQGTRDAILIGDSPAGLPLVHIHRIGGRDYRIELPDDGRSLTYEPVEPAETGRVAHALAGPALKALVVLGNNGSAYDLSGAGPHHLPPAEYRLAYGLLAAAGTSRSIIPTKETPAYSIQAGKVNRLRLGPPVRLAFSAKLSGGKISVSPALKVVGQGGERYEADFSDRSSRPRVAMYEGKRRLSQASMAYG
jgi:hypothetical protein